MFYSTVLLAAAAFTGLASAQNYTTSGPLNITASQIDPNTRASWCLAQTHSCPEICGGQAYPNSCDQNSLSYTCVCTNGQSPNISNYQQTIPFFLCQQWKANCVDGHPNDLNGITACQSVMCGTMNASSAESSSTSASASASASSTGGSGSGGSSAATTSGGSSPSSTASSTAAAASASKSSAAIAVSLAKDYGTGILATGLLAIFGLAL